MVNFFLLKMGIKMKYLLTIIVAISLTSCYFMDISKKDVDYIKKVNVVDMSHKFPISQESEIWGKTQKFIAEYSTNRISTVTPELIQTYETSSSFAWTISKIKYEKDFELMIKVNYINAFGGGDDMSKFQEKMLMQYLLTGEFDKRFLNCNTPDCRQVLEPNKIKTID